MPLFKKSWTPTNDGAGSGLDADLLDGLNSATANTASTVVVRDASGNFSAGTITAALTGNAATATTASTVTMSAGRTDPTAYPVVWGTTGGTSQLYSATAVNVQSSTGTLTATNLSANITATITGANLGGTIGDRSDQLSLRGSNGNGNFFDIGMFRDGTGADWQTAGTRFQQKIDATFMGWMQFNGAGKTAGISWGTGTTTVSAQAVVERMRIDSVGTISLGAAPGSESLRVTPVASAVNYLEVRGAATGVRTGLVAQGSDTDIGVNISGKGTGDILFTTNTFSNAQFQIVHTTSAVNYLQVTGNAAGSFPYIAATGSDTNVAFGYYAKGTGSHFFHTNNTVQFNIAHTASAVNYLQATGGIIGTGAALSAQGSDTNINITLTPKGNGGVGIGAAALGYTRVYIGGTLSSEFNVSHSFETEAAIPSTSTTQAIGVHSRIRTSVASFTLANLFQFKASAIVAGAGSAITNQYGFHAEGAVSGVTNDYGFYSNLASGTGKWNFYANGTAANVFAGITHIGGLVGAESLRVTPVTSAVNYWNFYGSTTTNAIAMYATGSDANIPVIFISKGTGAQVFYTNGPTTPVVQFNIAHTASAVNYVEVTGGSAGTGVALLARGTDTNIPITFNPKGTGGVVFPAGAVGTPSISTTGDLNTGIYFPAADNVGISTGGTVRLTTSTAQFTATLPWRGQNGTAAAPAFSASADTNTGMYFSAADTIGFAAGGVLGFSIGTTASAVNYLQAAGGATGSGATLSTQGTDTNINLILTPKGTGNVGIGITNPGGKLNVVGDVLSDTYLNANGSFYFQARKARGTVTAPLIITSSDVIGGMLGQAYNGSGWLTGAKLEFRIDGTVTTTSTPTALTLFTGDGPTTAERMRISPTGQLHVGTTTNPTGNSAGILNMLSASGDGINFKHTVAGNNGFNIWQTGTTTFNALAFYKGDAQTNVGAISCSTTATAYNTTSDYRLKENILPMTRALAKVASLKPCTYTWKSNGLQGQGFIAHELQDVVPDAVTGEKDEVYSNGNPKYQGVDTSFLVATLVAAIQEQQILIAQLQSDVAMLKSNNG